jgi:hypothetical protein
MKKIWIYLIPLFLFSCMEKKNTRDYIETIKSFETSTEQGKVINDQMFGQLNTLSNDLLTDNPNEVKPWYDEVLLLRSKSQSILTGIEAIKYELLDGRMSTPENLEQARYRIYPIDKNRIETLTNDLTAYKNEILIYFVTVGNHNGKDQIYSIDDLLDEDISFIKGNILNKMPVALKFYAWLSKIENDVVLAESEILKVFLIQIKSEGFKFLTDLVVIEPMESVVRRGEEFSCEIYLSGKDATIQPDIFVEGEKLMVINGKAQYKKHVSSSKIGQVEKNGVIKFVRYTGDSTSIPFKIEYQVVK